MTFDEIVGILVSRLGRRPDMKAKIESEILYVQREVIEKEENFVPWLLIQDDLDPVSFSSGDEYVDMPSDFLAPYEFGFAYLENSAGVILPNPLKSRTYDQLLIRGVDESNTVVTGDPTHYALVGRRMYLRPSPTRSGTIHLKMYATQDAINSKTAATHPILAHASGWLLNATGALIAQNTQNTRQQLIFEGLAARDRRKVQGKTEDLLAEAQIRKGGEL